MTDVRKLQMEEFLILKEFIRICKENHLRYYLIGGTLLGAVRHQGFIPWDDDVDVSMPREDYNRLLQLFKKGIKTPYQLNNYTNDSLYRYPWARMSSDKMKIINHSANIPREEYAWIDIIPLDGFPNQGIKRVIHKISLSFWWNLNQIVQFDELVDQKRKRSWKGVLSLKIASCFKWIGKIVHYPFCLKKMNKCLEKYPYDSDTNEIINFLAAYGFDEIFPRRCFGSGKKYLFEGIEMVGPDDYDSICKIIYGDYMTLPPEEDRNKHNSTIVEGG